MYDGFVGQRIAVTTKALRRLGTWLLFAALTLAIYSARTFINVKQGPAPFDETQLAAIPNPTLTFRNYGSVQGRNTFSTGITSVEKTTRNGAVESVRTTAEFMAMIVGKHVLIVKAKAGEKAEKYIGGIVSLPDDVKREIFSEITDPELQTATLPLMLDATGSYDDDLPLMYAAIGALVLCGLWAMTLAMTRSDAPERHPLCKALSKYGPLYSVVPQIDGEVTAGSSTFGNTTFTQNWVIACWLTKSFVMRRDEIIWMYKKRTKQSVNLIPVGSRYSLILRDTRGKQVQISNSEANIDNYISGVAEQTPWVIFGYDRKLEKLYRKERQKFSQSVASRKTAMQDARA